jgi:AraC-like DNA-binding protein
MPAGSDVGPFVGARRARDLIDRHHAEPLDLDTIARDAGTRATT